MYICGVNSFLLTNKLSWGNERLFSESFWANFQFIPPWSTVLSARMRLQLLCRLYRVTFVFIVNINFFWKQVLHHIRQINCKRKDITVYIFGHR